MKKLLLTLLMMVFGGTLACSKFARKDDEANRKDRAVLEAIARRRESGQTQVALKEVRAFRADRGNSVYADAARLEEGRSLEALGRYSEAEELYKYVRDKSTTLQSGLAPAAEWRLSFVAEAQGDDLRALSHLLGAERRRSELPVSVATVEIPARKAVLYQRLGREDDARAALKDADRGLSAILSAPGPKPKDEWLARLYLEMGRSTTSSVDPENFNSSLRAQRISQTYLLKALRSSDAAAPSQAFELLRANYAKLWSTALTPGLERDKQIPMMAELLRVLEEALQSRPVGAANNAWEEKFFAIADVLSAKGREVLYSNSETTVLTRESNLLNSIRRAPVPEKKPTPVRGRDPNM